MLIRPLVTLGLLLATAGPVAGQHGVAVQRPQTAAPNEASEYDFLVGQWDLVIKVPAPSLAVRIHGGMPKLVGTWKAWRALDGWGIEDELRITDKAGNPVSLSHSVRLFDLADRRWAVSAIDVYRGRIVIATSEKRGAEMTVASKGTDPDGKPYQSRTRIYEITPTSFRLQQDRSTDDGKTWTEGTLKIEAKRVAATAPR